MTSFPFPSHSHFHLKFKSHSYIFPSSNSQIPPIPILQFKLDIILCTRSMAVDVGCKKPRFLGFPKKTKNLNSPNFSFVSFFKKNLNNSDFRLTFCLCLCLRGGLRPALRPSINCGPMRNPGHNQRLDKSISIRT